jgi:CRISPR-associated protein Cas5t
MARVNVLKVHGEAVTASFRYPRVQIGRLPTFDMPPPATIYGHLAGVLGEWFDPSGLDFGYTFQHEGKGVDVETAHVIERGSGKPGLKKRGWDHPVNVEGAPNPQKREFLLRPRFVLYLRGMNDLLERLRSAFLSPHYAYVLGRSQDLATVRSAEFDDLTESNEAFFSHTLLPYDWRPYVLPGSSVALPVAIDYTLRRMARQERYLQVTSPALQVYVGSADTIRREELPGTFPVDRSDVRTFGEHALPRGIYFHAVLNR